MLLADTIVLYDLSLSVYVTSGVHIIYLIEEKTFIFPKEPHWINDEVRRRIQGQTIAIHQLLLSPGSRPRKAEDERPFLYVTWALAVQEPSDGTWVLNESI